MQSNSKIGEEDLESTYFCSDSTHERLIIPENVRKINRKLIITNFS